MEEKIDTKDLRYRGDVNVVKRYSLLTLLALPMCFSLGLIAANPIIGGVFFISFLSIVIWVLNKYAPEKHLVLFFNEYIAIKNDEATLKLSYADIKKIEHKNPYRDIARMTIWFTSPKEKVTFKLDHDGNLDKTTKEVVKLILSKNKSIEYLNKINR